MHSRLQAAPRSTDETCFSQRGACSPAKNSRRKSTSTPQGQHEIAQVPAVERAVDVGRKQRQFALRGVAHEIRRSVVHEVHHAVATADNGLTVAPGDGRGEKSRDLAVGAVRIAVRYRNRIVGDEVGAVVFVVERVEQLLQIGVRHGVRSIRSKTSVCGMP